MGLTSARAFIMVGLIGLAPSLVYAQAAPAKPKPAVDVTKVMIEAAAKIGAAALKPAGPELKR